MSTTNNTGADLCSGRAPDVGPFSYVSVSPPATWQKGPVGPDVACWRSAPSVLLFRADLYSEKRHANLHRGQGIFCGEGIEILVTAIKRFSCTTPSLMDWDDLIRGLPVRTVTPSAESGLVSQAQKRGLRYHRGATSDIRYG